jgi:hypothetical protein
VRSFWLVFALGACGHIGFEADAGRDASGGADSSLDAFRGVPMFVQHGDAPCGPVISCAVTLSSPHAAGDVVVVVVTYDTTAPQVTTISDGLDTFKNALAPSNWPVSTYRTEVWYGILTTSSSMPLPILAMLSQTAGTGIWVYADEYSGVDPIAPVDMTTFTGGTSGTAVSSGFVTTRRPNEVVFGHAEGMGLVVMTGAGFTARMTKYGNIQEDKPAAAAGSYDAEFTLSTMGEWIALVTTIEPP